MAIEPNAPNEKLLYPKTSTFIETASPIAECLMHDKKSIN